MQTSVEEKPSVTITFPAWLLSILKIVDYGAGAMKTTVKQMEETITKKPKFRLPKLGMPFQKESFKRFFRSYKKVLISAVVVLVLLGGFFALKSGGSLQAENGTISVGSGDVSTVEVNRRFEVPIKNQDGSETGENLGITITKIEKTNNILIQNNPAKTKPGKIFLVINLEIQNDTRKQLKVRPVDMVRLIGQDGKNYAPDVHNNEVSAEPISLRKTRVGYVVDENQKTFKLLIGEVRGQQDAIEVTF